VLPSREVLSRRSSVLAPRMLGAVITSEIGGASVTIRITEVEAYEGADDPASHAFRGPTPRTAVMFGQSGALYCYFSYGMHWCANVVCGPAGTASALLLRAGEVITGAETAFARRPAARTQAELARGPARLAACLGLNGDANGVDLLSETASVRLMSVASRRPPRMVSGPRVGISRGTQRPWRFWLEGEATVSPYRAGVRSRPAADGRLEP